MEPSQDNIHTADRVEVSERMDIALKNSDTLRPEEQIESILAGMAVSMVVLRDYCNEPHLADRIRGCRIMLNEAYHMGYWQVIQGRDPQKPTHRQISISTYLTKWRGYREYSDKMRLSLVWDDINILLRRTAITFEDMQAQKYRTYSSDVAVQSMLGILYGSIALLEEIEEPVRKAIENASDVGINPDTDKLKVNEYLEDEELFTPYGKHAIQWFRFGREYVPDVQSVLGEGVPVTIGDLAIRCGCSSIAVRTTLDKLIKKGAVEEVEIRTIPHYRLKTVSSE